VVEGFRGFPLHDKTSRWRVGGHGMPGTF
jgi:hypothetical protein